MGVSDGRRIARWRLKRVAGWPAGVKAYVQELQLEMRRVTWPSRKQVRATTGVVIVCVFAFAAYFDVVDLVIGRTITRVFTLLTQIGERMSHGGRRDGAQRRRAMPR